VSGLPPERESEDDGRVSDLDLVLWGATGYTGRLVAGYLSRRAPEGLRWAIGGCDRTRLETLRTELGDQAAVVVGDSLDPASIDAIVQRTRVLATTVGPFARYGTPLVEACAAHGTDYCDITGEVQWIRGNVDRLHDQAVESGARIVHCCGFDSIPSDLGVWMLHEHLQREHGRGLSSVRFYVMNMRGGFSGGTVTSMLDLLEQASGDLALRRMLANPYALNPEGQREGPDRPDQQGARYDAALGRWTAPFVMAAINTRIVRRTNSLLGYPYGREFRYGESVVAPRRLAAQVISLGLKATVLGGLFGPTRWLMRRLMPKPGQGPTPAAREAGFFKILLAARSDGESPLEVRGRVGGDSDPGYGETSKMLAESALCLALDELPARAGILTPASAMGTALIERLRATGMIFEIED